MDSPERVRSPPPRRRPHPSSSPGERLGDMDLAQHFFDDSRGISCRGIAREASMELKEVFVDFSSDDNESEDEEEEEDAGLEEEENFAQDGELTSNPRASESSLRNGPTQSRSNNSHCHNHHNSIGNRRGTLDQSGISYNSGSTGSSGGRDAGVCENSHSSGLTSNTGQEHARKQPPRRRGTRSGVTRERRASRRTLTTSTNPSNSSTARQQTNNSSTNGGTSLLSFLSYNEKKSSGTNIAASNSDDVSRADLFLEGLRRENQSKNHEDADDDGTVMTQRRKDEREKRREQMRDRMRRERNQQQQKHQTTKGQQRPQPPLKSSTEAHIPISNNSLEEDECTNSNIEGDYTWKLQQDTQSKKKQLQHAQRQNTTGLKRQTNQQEQQNLPHVIKQANSSNPQIYSVTQRPQKEQGQHNILYVSSDGEDDDNHNTKDDDGNDDGTVIQFDPTQKNSVFMVKQLHHIDSECPVQSTGRTKSVRRISELKDPPPDAHKHTESPKSPALFDFMEHQSSIDPMDKKDDVDIDSILLTDTDDMSDEAETLPPAPTLQQQEKQQRTKKKKNRRSAGEPQSHLSTNRDKPGNNHKGGLIADAQKYTQFLTQTLGKTKREKLGDTVKTEISILRGKRKSSKKKNGDRSQLYPSQRMGQGHDAVRQPQPQQGFDSQGNIGIGVTQSHTKSRYQSPSGLKKPSYGVNDFDNVNFDKDAPYLSNDDVSNVEIEDDDYNNVISSPRRRVPPNLSEFLPKQKGNHTDIPAHDPEASVVNPPSNSGGSLMGPSGGESIDSPIPSNPSKNKQRKGIRPRPEGGGSNSRNELAGESNTEERNGRNYKSERHDEIHVSSDTAASPMTQENNHGKSIPNGLAFSIGRYFASRGRGGRAATDVEDNDTGDDDDGSVASSFSLGLFGRGRRGGGLGNRILLGDDSSSYESSSANTR